MKNGKDVIKINSTRKHQEIDGGDEEESDEWEASVDLGAGTTELAPTELASVSS